MELKNPSDAFAFMEKYEDEFSMQGNTSVLRWMGVSGNASFEGMLNGMLTILIVIIGVGAVSLIYNAFSISLRERTTQFGLLSSIGATKRQLRRSMWQEALVVGQSEFRSGFSAELEESELRCILSEIPWRSLSMVHRVER